MPVDLNEVDLNLLVAFEALMAERSVTRAATRLSVGQSAMSSTLGRLRTLFNDPILVREGRTMVATPVAESLVETVRDVLDRIHSLLSEQRDFDPTVDHQSFTVAASDYAYIAVLHPLLTRLASDAPHTQLLLLPVGVNSTRQLVRHEIDLLVVPREAVPEYREYHNQVLYIDRYLLAVDTKNPEVGDTIDLDQFSELPYLATHTDLHKSLADIQLDLLGIPRRVEATAGFMLAPFLLRDTSMVTLIPETLGRRIAEAARIKLIEPPMQLLPLTETMLWTDRADQDTAHRWLRSRLLEIAGLSTAKHHVPSPDI